MNRLFQRWLISLVLISGVLYYLLYSQHLPLFSLSSEPRHIDWASIPQKHAITAYASLPSGAPKQLPKVQAESFATETDAQRKERVDRRDAIRDVFLRSWKAYKRNAWGHDEFAPLSGSWKDHFGGWGATIVDSLDTLLLMELNDEFQDAVKACRNIDFSVTHVEVINVFETTVRFLGGLLSAHELAEGKDDGVLLQKAKELSEMLYHSFDTENRMPIARWTWRWYARNATDTLVCRLISTGHIMAIQKKRILTLSLQNLDLPVLNSPDCPKSPAMVGFLTPCNEFPISLNVSKIVRKYQDYGRSHLTQKTRLLWMIQDILWVGEKIQCTSMC
jgi:hypothetical protein